MHEQPPRPSLLPLALALLMGCSTGAPSETASPPRPSPEDNPAPSTTTASPLLGLHDLTLSPDAGWRRHALEITEVSDTLVQGVVTVDLGIGPEGRAPGADEIVHRVAFKADRGADPHRLRLSVTIGDLDPTLVTLDLWACPEAGQPTCGAEDDRRLTGTATFESQRAGASTLDAVARPTRSRGDR